MSDVRLPIQQCCEIVRYLINQQNSRKIQAYAARHRQNLSRLISDFEPHEKRIVALEDRLKHSIQQQGTINRKPTTNPPTIFAKLPEECLNHLFSYCKPKVLVKLALTSVEMYRSAMPYLYSKPVVSSLSSLKALITTLRLDSIINPVKSFSLRETLGSYVKVLDLDTLSLKTPITELFGLSEFIQDSAVFMPNIRKFYFPTQISLSGKQAYFLLDSWSELVHFEAVLSSTTRNLVDHNSFRILLNSLALSDPTERATRYISTKVKSTYSLHLSQSTTVNNTSDLEASSIVKLIEASRKNLTKFSLLAQRDLDGQIPPSALAALSIFIGGQLTSLVLSRTGSALDAPAVTAFSTRCPNLTMLVLGGGPQDILSDEIISAFSSLRYLKIIYIRSFQLSKAESVSELILNNRESLKVIYVVGSHQFLETRPSQVLCVPGLPFPKLEILALCGIRRHGLMLGDGELPDYVATLPSLCPKLYGIRLTPNPYEGNPNINNNGAGINEMDVDPFGDDDEMVVAEFGVNIDIAGPGLGPLAVPPQPPPAVQNPQNAPPQLLAPGAFFQPLGQALAGLEQAVNQANQAAMEAQNVVNQALGVLNQAVPGLNNNQPVGNNQPNAINNNANFVVRHNRIPSLPRKIGRAYIIPTFYSSDIARWDDDRVYGIYKRHIKNVADQMKRRTAGRAHSSRQRPPNDDGNDNFPPFDGEDDESKKKDRPRRVTPLPPHILGPFPGPIPGIGFLGFGPAPNNQNAVMGNIYGPGANQQNQQDQNVLPLGLNNFLDGIFGNFIGGNNNGGNFINAPGGNNNNDDDNDQPVGIGVGMVVDIVFAEDLDP